MKKTVIYARYSPGSEQTYQSIEWQLAEYRADAVTDLLKTGKILDEFDKTIFKSLVNKIKVIADKEIEIEFECGIKVTEKL